MLPQLTIIAAMDQNNGIGFRNKLPWKRLIPADMRRFRNRTYGHVVVMGRKTFDSLPKPLEGRTNLVLSTQSNLRIEHPNCFVIHEPAQALSWGYTGRKIDVIGGAQVYTLFLENNAINRMVLTRIQACFEVDTYFPEINWSDWSCVNREYVTEGETTPYDLIFEEYIRRS